MSATLHSPGSLAGGFGGGIETMGDLNGDGVPELWIEEGQVSLTHLFDGRTSELLKTIEYPGDVQSDPGPKFGITAIRQSASPGIHALMFAAPRAVNYEGRVYYMPFTGLPRPARMTALRGADNTFTLQISGEPGLRFGIQATSDFSTWEQAASVTTGEQPITVDDLIWRSHPRRFYRALQLP